MYYFSVHKISYAAAIEQDAEVEISCTYIVKFEGRLYNSVE
jgi:hypothetical protein